MVSFMRQIPFLAKWKQRDLMYLYQMMKDSVVKIENRGQYLFKEGDEC